MKSVSLVDSNAIRNHPSNNSSSKNAYQFSKTERFPAYNPEYDLIKFILDVKSHFIAMTANYLIVKLHSGLGKRQISLSLSHAVLLLLNIISSLTLRFKRKKVGLLGSVEIVLLIDRI